MNKKNLLKNSHFKVGIFGASFNPLHLGHLNLLIQVQEKFEFNLIKVIPTWQSPLASLILEVSPEKRLAIVRKVFKPYPFIEVDDQEIKRKNISYTIDTIKKVSVSFKEIFLIMGIDQLAQFDKWKDFQKIIETVHLVICSRKGYEWSASIIPPLLQQYILSFQEKSKEIKGSNIQNQSFKTDKVKHKMQMTKGKNIYWFPLNDMDISSFQIRVRRRQGLSISHLIPPLVEQWIQKQNLYQKTSSIKEFDILVLIKFCADTLLNKKGQKIKAFDLRPLSSLPFDFSIVVSGLNVRHTKVLASYLHRQVKKEFSLCAQQMEGQENGEWIVLDYGELIVHIFYDYTREYYCLEDLWQKAKTLSLK